MKKSIIAEVLFVLIMGFLGFYEGIRLTRVQLLNPDPMGPGWYLVAISGLLLLFGFLYLLLPETRKTFADRTQKKIPRSFHIGSGGQLMIVLPAYAIAIPLIGYFYASLFFFVMTFYISGVKSWLKSIAYGIASTIIFKLLFVNIAGISFP
jgi:hypothetical protein